MALKHSELNIWEMSTVYSRRVSHSSSMNHGRRFWDVRSRQSANGKSLVLNLHHPRQPTNSVQISIPGSETVLGYALGTGTQSFVLFHS